RNMQNFNLLSEVGRANKPVLLKRGPAASIEELLMAAEYVVKEGNARVILCERGITTFERATRYTLDISAIPVLKQETHLPVIVGTRLIGASVGLAAREAGVGEVQGWDVNPDALAAAAERGAVDAAGSLGDAVSRASLVVVAAPVAALPVQVAAVLAATSGGT